MKKKATALEFGDFQTPSELAREAVTHLKKHYPDFQPKTIIEPTCGIGTFLLATADAYPDAKRIVGVETESDYLNEVRSEVANRQDAHRFDLREADFFKTNWEDILETLPAPFLIVGNPPWVTNADIGRLRGSNLPQKSNFLKYTGIEAVTGKSNFDISEWMLRQNLKWIREHSGCLAILCKTSVARKILCHAWKESMLISESHMVQIDALKYFSASVDACFFVLKTSTHQKISRDCKFFHSFDEDVPANVFGYHRGLMISHIGEFHKNREVLGKDRHYTWRSGVKHDSSKVMELRRTEGGLKNGYGEPVEIEDSYLFPLLKSSDLANEQVHEARRNIIVTQQKIGQETENIQFEAPLTWQYLEHHADALDGRKSSIYSNKPRFSIFGVGDYTFTNWKVAISGFYKCLRFQVVGPIKGKPAVFDDTVYFLSLDTEEEADFLCDLLRSTPCQKFLESMIFWSDKRPITADLLKRVDLQRVALVLGKEDEYTHFTELSNSQRRPLERSGLGE